MAAKKTTTAKKVKVPTKSAVVKGKTTAKKTTAKTATKAAPKKASPKKAAPKKAVAKKKTVSPEERYTMIQEEAYFRAERTGFNVDPVENWIAAEKEVANRLK